MNKKLKLTLVICVCDDIRIINTLNSINYDVEVILVLNGSPKEFLKEIKKYQKKSNLEIKIIQIPEKNLSKARNIGVINAKHNKVVFYDSDTVIVGKALELYNEYLDKYLLVDGKVMFKNNGFQSKTISVLRSMGLPGYALCPSIGINKKIKKYIKYYFDEDIKWIEDSELNIRAKKQNIEVGIIEELTCIHDNLTFKQDLKSAFRYGTGVKTAARKNLHKKRPTANWNLIIPCFKENTFSGIYCIIWNLVYCVGYYIK